MLQQRGEAKIRRKESSLQTGIELTTTRSWVRHAHHWATQAGNFLFERHFLFQMLGWRYRSPKSPLAIKSYCWRLKTRKVPTLAIVKNVIREKDRLSNCYQVCTLNTSQTVKSAYANLIIIYTGYPKLLNPCISLNYPIGDVVCACHILRRNGIPFRHFPAWHQLFSYIFRDPPSGDTVFIEGEEKNSNISE